METKIWIILASVLGFLVLAMTLTLVLFCWKRSAKKVRFSLRAVTPLDDAEFESWRRPGPYTQQNEKYIIKPTQPSVAHVKKPNVWEKELGLDMDSRSPPETPYGSADSSSPIAVLGRVRRQSSVSLADRPPTPYSPCSFTGELPRKASRSAHKSTRSPPRSPRPNHYPSMSETSDSQQFDFGFNGQMNSYESTSPLYQPMDPFAKEI
ncbi:hypothetical protein GQ43DRAFT_368575 [Delitschia confertaspora ATCC 74209]|uniref:Uncharacterized protein n=1 Tax=Delitschia confertaspora ATCC 74209 TaxID=1513339 RepID=A0A9P4MX00_9PLEO|nr:hypothetical protein GQ43DRAFT_368575 [Delitschia confertaspora ATCC 74209]